jgi:metal-responsive CopG/Arc/MetJ family transcriptional regulator
MRILVDVPDGQLKELARLGAASKRSRAAIIREALTSYLSGMKRSKIDDAFGLWGDHEVDGLDYQRKLRSEW